ncbi:MAG: hypothetical protein GY847_17570, partial [Proteobacteria bacterium]|nr:hypothetical protein [Pseudomonadota bacterium]
MRSLWKAHYQISDGLAPSTTIREENVFVKVMDELIGQIPLIGFLSGYVFHPSYCVTDQNGITLMRLIKQLSFFESSFRIEKEAKL